MYIYFESYNIHPKPAGVIGLAMSDIHTRISHVVWCCKEAEEKSMLLSLDYPYGMDISKIYPIEKIDVSVSDSIKMISGQKVHLDTEPWKDDSCPYCGEKIIRLHEREYTGSQRLDKYTKKSDTNEMVF